MQQSTKIQKKAGGIIMRQSNAGVELFLIHRHRYNDWSFPKGHLDSGESLEEAAIREVAEETGLQCAIIAPLPDMHYTDPAGNEHQVAWFIMHALGSTHLSIDKTEVDGGEWVPLSTVREQLSYDSAKEYFDSIDSLLRQHIDTL